MLDGEYNILAFNKQLKDFVQEKYNDRERNVGCVVSARKLYG